MPFVFPDEVLEHVLVFLDAHKDRNSVSLVCKAWFRAEGWSRRKVFIGNCYALSPALLLRRFPKLTSLEMKGRPRFTDFGLVPPNWGAVLQPWVEALVEHYSGLEELRLKRMTVSDECLRMVASGFPNFRALRMTSCDGFSTNGLTAISRSCRNLTELDLQENDMQIQTLALLKSFPATQTSLECLNFATFRRPVSEAEFQHLEALVSRCRSLKRLKLSMEMSQDQVLRILMRAPQLVELGTGLFNPSLLRSSTTGGLDVVQASLVGCKNIRTLSGLWDLGFDPITRALTPIYRELLTLDISNVFLSEGDFSMFILFCKKLQRLLVQDHVGDEGLRCVSQTCTDLRELRVYCLMDDALVTESGFLSISQGCPDLRKILYFCKQMTNAAMASFARNCPKLTHFRLCIIRLYQVDCDTKETLDFGFGEICKRCPDLRRLSLSGLLTDTAFQYIGRYAKKLETLSVAFAGDSDLGMQCVLEGCPKLRKLEVRDCPFGNEALLMGIEKYESMRALWMSTCKVTMDGCQFLAEKNPSLNVEVIREEQEEEERLMVGEQRDEYVEKLYVYRTLAGRRTDAPPFVGLL